MHYPSGWQDETLKPFPLVVGLAISAAGLALVLFACGIL